MTDLALRLPLAAGGAALEATGNALHWVVARYMRAPLGNTGVLALVTLTALAGSNALFFQEQQHPSPLFTPVATAHTFEVAPVVPAPRPQSTLPTTTDTAEVLTGSVEPRAVVEPAPAAAEATLDNAEVLEIQRKLSEMRLYSAALDGLYGPRTAAAIREFEAANGMQPTGELSRELLEAVRAAKVVAPASAATNPPTDADADVTFQPMADEPHAAAELAPLPTPAPLAATVSQPAPRNPAAPAPVASAEATPTAARESVESIITGVQTMAMTTPGDPPPAVAGRQAAPETTGSVAAQETAPDDAPIPVLGTDATPEQISPFSASDRETIARVQRGLASLGFLHGPADGVFGEATARAIRNFEIYYNYSVTGRITPELPNLLVQNGAAL